MSSSPFRSVIFEFCVKILGGGMVVAAIAAFVGEAVVMVVFGVVMRDRNGLSGSFLDFQYCLPAIVFSKLLKRLTDN